jgi:hypothetical protein
MSLFSVPITLNNCSNKCICTGLSLYVCLSVKNLASEFSLSTLSSHQKAKIKNQISNDDIKITESIQQAINNNNILIESRLLYLKDLIRNKSATKNHISNDYADLGLQTEDANSLILLLLKARNRIFRVLRGLRNEKLSRRSRAMFGNIMQSLIRNFDDSGKGYRASISLKSTGSVGEHQNVIRRGSGDDIERTIMKLQEMKIRSETQNPMVSGRNSMMPLLDFKKNHSEEQNMTSRRRLGFTGPAISGALSYRSDLQSEEGKKNDSNEEFIITTVLGPDMIGEYCPASNFAKKIEVNPKIPLKTHACIVNCTEKNLIYIESGLRNMGPHTKQVLLINLISKTIIELQKPNATKISCGLPVCVDEIIYTFGGASDESSVKTCEKYDIPKNSWSFIAELPFSSILNSGFFIGKTIYLVGYHIPRVLLYDLENDTYWADAFNIDLSGINKNEIRFLCGINNRLYYFMRGRIYEGPNWTLFSALSNFPCKFMLRNWGVFRGKIYLLLDDSKVYVFNPSSRLSNLEAIKSFSK